MLSSRADRYTDMTITDVTEGVCTALKKKKTFHVKSLVRILSLRDIAHLCHKPLLWLRSQYFVLMTQSFPKCLMDTVEQLVKQQAKVDDHTILETWWFALVPFWWPTCGVSHVSITTSHLTSMHLPSPVHVLFLHVRERGGNKTQRKYVWFSNKHHILQAYSSLTLPQLLFISANNSTR